ncbi:MAG: tRNA (adenosine(37)-N6)-threonylcarbamoyltransferase complex dimerization subunit type 1 TsaB [Candidatus Buchananbacteria bacterium]|nr:tRNA (adenosine(37)-N6)-threonylcarbamoyltransferase complex dimerization subunit type 1 TsaB [Candidatus Buchananbacteria bacterium]
MILFINTSKADRLDVFLIKDNKIFDKIDLVGDHKVSENLLNLISKLLKKNKMKPEQLKGIITVTGPGPFTSLRIAVAVANALAYSLKIPVAGIEMKQKRLTNNQAIKLGLEKLTKAEPLQYIKPFYNKEPNITMANK